MFNPHDRDTVVTVARMTANSYTTPGRPNWIDLGGWKVVCNATFGWQDHGLRGYIFATESKDIVVIVFKGTSIIGNPTAHIDKYNDNLMFSCCCGSQLKVSSISPLMKPICGCARGPNKCNRFCLGQVTRYPNSYYHHALKIYEAASERYPNAEIWLTGHSLGGALSSLIGIQKGRPAFTFEAPGELMYARRLNLPIPEDMSTLPIYHFGNTADPVYVGSCNGPGSLCSIAGYAMDSKCHTGNVCTFDTVEEMGWKSSLHNHQIRRVINELLVPWKYFESPVRMKCEVENECVDCGLWEYV
ncbi:alpha/beta-hydrolase [Basidiobolus meristosporus CBS 931.73]|uniref:triacylglycerol lipase n=1 Tax=Basidiobolus meristosporus CBS 931.73 TaxID=1314790 RepID=A0A1Y1YCB7_9FUNG|nr:alpha/beta-hydrolase [Basidiobolus meristosporus CBS 931.73]|eukprot:ORX95612.1 alpha/beta-hydrolase [Basidiobolus meristosporus CBS 931.73]